MDGTLEWNLEWFMDYIGFYFIGCSFVRALPEDGNAAS